MAWLLALAAGALALAGCGGGGDLPPCDAPERQAQAARVVAVPASTSDSLRRAFAARSRVQDVRMEQRDCHIHVRVRVDSFATPRYASTQGLEMMRALKSHLPNETRPLTEEPVGEVGKGIYDYAVVFVRGGQVEQGRSRRGPDHPGWMRLSKSYDSRRVLVQRQ